MNRKDWYWWRFHVIWRKHRTYTSPERGYLYYGYPSKKPYTSRTIDFYTRWGFLTFIYRYKGTV